MKTLTTTLLAAAVLAGAMASESAWAHGRFNHHHSRARIGVFIGAPVVFAPWHHYHPRRYYYPSYYHYSYDYPAPVVVPSQPPVYIEQGNAQPSPSPAPRADWYYCPESKTYYPYVDRCAVPWQRVAPHPPS
jgi:hypothetical protein